MIEIVLDDERYLFYANDIIYVNAYKSCHSKDYYISINLVEKENIELDFGDDHYHYMECYNLIKSKMEVGV